MPERHLRPYGYPKPDGLQDNKLKPHAMNLTLSRSGGKNNKDSGINTWLYRARFATLIFDTLKLTFFVSLWNFPKHFP